MDLRTRRRTLALLVLLPALAGAGCGGSLFKERYEYEEELELAIDGSAVMRVNASEAALVALRGAPLDPRPDARPDRAAIRALFSGPGVEPGTPTFSRRDGRRFVHVTVDVDDIRQLPRLAPFAWSTYQMDRRGDLVTFRQRVGRAVAAPVPGVAWRGDERVAFRMHIPSRVVFENGTTDVQRGNIVGWVQPLSERLAGVPVDIEVRMEPQSILYSTLLLFGATAGAAALTFAAVVWWVVRRGRRALAEEPARGSRTSTSLRAP